MTLWSRERDLTRPFSIVASNLKKQENSGDLFCPETSFGQCGISFRRSKTSSVTSFTQFRTSFRRQELRGCTTGRRGTCSWGSMPKTGERARYHLLVQGA